MMGPADGSACFSAFHYRPDEALRFEAVPYADTPPGIVKEWQLSRPFKGSLVDRERTPLAQGLPDLGWKRVTAEPDGLCLLYTSPSPRD